MRTTALLARSFGTSAAWIAMALLIVGCGQRSVDTPKSESSPAAAATVESTTGAPEEADAAGGTAAAAAREVPTGASAETATLASYEPRKGPESDRPTSLREAYPGYNPGANDPELESTRTGRREVAVHDRTFDTGGAASLADLVAAIVSGIDRADGEALDRTAVSYDDFQTIIWPEMPQSRPAANVPAGESWDFLRRRHLSAFNRTSGDHAGTGLTVQSIEVGNVVEYTNFRLHDDLRVTVTDATGNVSVFPMIRTVAECRGRFKLYSTRD